MQSRLRKKGSILRPTDPRLARPGQVLEVTTNYAHSMVLHASLAGTNPKPSGQVK